MTHTASMNDISSYGGPGLQPERRRPCAVCPPVLNLAGEKMQGVRNEL